MKQSQSGFTIVELVMVLGFVGVFGGILFVLVHFLSKFW